MAKSKVGVLIVGAMEVNTMVTGVTIKLTALEFTLGLTAENSLDSGKTTIWRVLEYTPGRTAVNTRENTTMTKKKGMVLMYGRMDVCIWGSGSEASSMV